MYQDTVYCLHGNVYPSAFDWLTEWMDRWVERWWVDEIKQITLSSFFTVKLTSVHWLTKTKETFLLSNYID